MKTYQWVVFTILIFLAMRVDWFTLHCEDYILSGQIKDDYTHLYLTSESLAHVLYTGALSYLLFCVMNNKVISIAVYNFVQGVWLPMGLIDLKQDYYRLNKTYDAEEYKTYIICILISIIISAYQWNKRKLT